jgi:hypothetical protein
MGWVFVVLFSISALLQYNDPDAFLWIVIYCTAALVTLGFLFKKLSYFIPLIVGLLASVGFIYLFPEKFEGFGTRDGALKNIEEVREAFGLLIIAIVMFAISIRIRVHKTSEV